MSKRNTIYFIDSDDEYRQSLIKQFAISIDDYKLCAIRTLDELDIMREKGSLKKGRNFLVLSGHFLGENKLSIDNFITLYAKPEAVQKIIFYTGDTVEYKTNNLDKSYKKIMIIPQNDFCFFRLQNIIRNHVDITSYLISVIGFVISLSAFAILIGWLYFN